jgi:plastocyanin
MMRPRGAPLSYRFKAAFAAAVAALAIPASASATTKVVSIGPSSSDEKTLNTTGGADANDFFPHAVTIHVGDSVKFKPSQFHTVDFPAKGQKALGLLVPAGTASGVLDAAGNAFWFNGQPTLGFNPALLEGIYGTNVTYTGAKRVESGLPLRPKLKPFNVKFTKTGSFTYHCDLHPGMTGVVKVAPKRDGIPSAKTDNKTVAAQIKRDLKVAKDLASSAPPPGNVAVGPSGKHGVQLYTMLPATQTVAAGTTVKFSIPTLSFDAHTATLGPGDPDKEPNSYLGQIAAHFANDPVTPGEALYPSEPPGTLANLSPTLHGNGFWSSGVMTGNGAFGLPGSNSVTFTTPGTYQFYCLIHAFMKGQIVVQ